MPNVNRTDPAVVDDPAEERVYTIEDVVKMVSFWFCAVAHKADIVKVETAEDRSSFY